MQIYNLLLRKATKKAVEQLKKQSRSIISAFTDILTGKIGWVKYGKIDVSYICAGMKRKINTIKAYLLFLVTFLLSCESAFSQGNIYNEWSELQRKLRLTRSVDEMKFEYDGTPYLYKEFSDAELNLSTGQVYKTIPMNYNVHNDEFEFLKDDVAFALRHNTMVSSIIMNDKTFFFLTYHYKTSEVSGFLELIVDGKTRIYKRHRVIYQEPKEAVGYQEAQKASFHPGQPDYLIDLDNGHILYFKKLNNIADMVPDITLELKKYIKDNKLKIKREEDIIKLAYYLNSR